MVMAKHRTPCEQPHQFYFLNRIKPMKQATTIIYNHVFVYCKHVKTWQNDKGHKKMAQ